MPDHHEKNYSLIQILNRKNYVYTHERKVVFWTNLFAII